MTRAADATRPAQTERDWDSTGIDGSRSLLKCDVNPPVQFRDRLRTYTTPGSAPGNAILTRSQSRSAPAFRRCAPRCRVSCRRPRVRQDPGGRRGCRRSEIGHAVDRHRRSDESLTGGAEPAPRGLGTRFVDPDPSLTQQAGGERLIAIVERRAAADVAEPPDPARVRAGDVVQTLPELHARPRGAGGRRGQKVIRCGYSRS